MNETASGPTDRELRLIGAVAGKRVLDLGCGTGRAAITFAQQGAVVIAVDGSRSKLERARERARCPLAA
jgi:cyclopropane fatty-acyl-phospholipid synthase-like methyltransferase